MMVERAFVALATVELIELVNFYQQLFKAPPQVLRSDTYAEFHRPQLRLALFCPGDAKQVEFEQRQPGSYSLCLQVQNLEAAMVKDRPPAIAHLTDLGHPPQHPIIAASHGREVYVYDPAGHRIILYQPSP